MSLAAGDDHRAGGIGFLAWMSLDWDTIWTEPFSLNSFQESLACRETGGSRSQQQNHNPGGLPGGPSVLTWKPWKRGSF
jgi:hypothetical protein